MLSQHLASTHKARLPYARRKLPATLRKGESFTEAKSENTLATSENDQHKYEFVQKPYNVFEYKIDNDFTHSYGICVAFQVVNTELILLYKHRSAHYTIRYSYTKKFSGGAPPTIFTRLLEMLKTKSNRVSPVPGVSPPTEPLLIIAANRLPEIGTLVNEIRTLGEGSIYESEVSVHVDPTSEIQNITGFTEIPEVLIHEILTIVAESRAEIANMASVNTYFRGQVESLAEIHEYDDDDIRMQKREQLYVFIVMMCILERKRLFEAPTLKKVACMCKSNDGTCAFTIATTQSIHNNKPLRYINVVTFNNGTEVVISQLHYSTDLTEIDIIDANITQLSGLYRTVKQKCKPDPKGLASRSIHYKSLKLESMTVSSDAAAVEIKRMLGEEIDILKDMVSIRLADYIEELAAFINAIGKQLDWKNITLVSHAVTIDFLLKATLSIAKSTHATISDIHNAVATKERLECIMELKPHVVKFGKETHIQQTFRESRSSPYDWNVKTFEWIEGMSINSEPEKYTCSEALCNLQQITSAIFSYLGIKTTKPSIASMHAFYDLYTDIPNLENLVKASKPTSDVHVQYRTLSAKIASDCIYQQRYDSRKRVMHLLLTGYDVNVEIVGVDPDVDVYDYTTEFKNFDGIASMCLCAKFTHRVNGVIKRTHGLSDDEIDAFDGLMVEGMHPEMSLNPDNSPLYSDLASLYISDYFKCNPQKLSTYLMPYTRKVVNFPLQSNPPPSIIFDLHAHQKAIWDAKNDLTQYQRYSSTPFKTIRLELSVLPVYKSLFTRILSLNTPLVEFVASLYTTIEYIQWQQVNAPKGTPPDILSTDHARVTGIANVDQISRNNAKIMFDKDIAQLLTCSIVRRIYELRETIFSLAPKNIKEVNIYTLIHDIENHILIKQSKMSIDQHLIDSVSNVDATLMELFSRHAPHKTQDRISAMNENTMETTLIDEIKTVSVDAFIRDLSMYFMQALYCHIVKTNDVTVVKKTMKIIATKQYVAATLNTKIKALEEAKDAMDHLISNAIYHTTAKSGGGINRNYFLRVTNTITMRTIHKPIFKVNNQSKVRHNRELILVSKYKLIIGKRHNRQVKFEIIRKGKEKR